MNRSILLPALLIVASCHSHKVVEDTNSTKIVVIDEVVHPFLLEPLQAPILSLYDFEHNKSQEAAFDFVFINQQQLNPVAHLYLAKDSTKEDERSTEENTRRTAGINAFTASLQTAFTEDPRHCTLDGSPVNNSQVFCCIMTELSKLSLSHYRKKAMIIFSDLLENPNVFDINDAKSRNLLQGNPGAVFSQLSGRCSTPVNLSGITIIFVFKPRDSDEQHKFMDMLSAYQLFFQSTGAKVSSQSGNENFSWNND